MLSCVYYEFFKNICFEKYLRAAASDQSFTIVIFFFGCLFTIIKKNKRDDKRLNNRSYSLFFLIGIFLKHLWLIPNILKWQDCKIFAKLVPSQTSTRSSHRRRSVQKGVPENLRNCTGKHLCWSLILIKLQAFRPAFLFERNSNTVVFLSNLQNV